MRVGIISDVHGDYGALERTLKKMKKEHHVSRILCAGDLVGRGPDQNKVVACIRRNNIATVRGNHDEWFAGITSENRSYLKNLPLDWKGRVGNRRFYMCHGKPGNNMWGMYRDHLSDTYLNMVLKSLRTDVLITGHTHMPLYMQVEGGLLVNPGSLYTFESARHTSQTYAVLDLHDLNFHLFESSTLGVVGAEFVDE